MKDIVAVKWLSLGAAVKRLSFPLEKLFLNNVGRHAVRRHKLPQARKARRSSLKAKPASPQKSRSRRARG
jgi:hypothetical protein